MRVWLPLAVLAACNSDRYGAYLHVTAPVALDRVEFVFGGYMPSDACDHSTVQHVPVLRQTPSFINAPPSSNDEMFRRQLGNGDIRMLGGATEYTLYLDTPINDPTTPFDDTLGKTVVVIGTSGQTTLVGELDDFAIPDAAANIYEIALTAVAAQDLERWGGGEERCLRYTRQLASGTVASKFIVPTWDRDCDGFYSQLCYTADGKPIDDDCDPLRFCDVAGGDPAACTVRDACLSAATGTNQGCRLAACTNQAGHLHKVCAVPEQFCIDEAACAQPPTCARPLGDCVALDLPADVECDVPVLKLAKANTDEGTLCAATNAVSAPFLTGAMPGTTCLADLIVPVISTRTLGVTITTPAGIGSCDLDLAPTDMAPVRGLLTETRVLVRVLQGGLTPGGSLVIDVKPIPVDNCANAPPMMCQPTDPSVHVCPM